MTIVEKVKAMIAKDDLNPIATFKLEHDQLTGIPQLMEERIIAPINRLKIAMTADINTLGNIVNKHAELAKALYNDNFADGSVAVAGQALSISAAQVKELAIQRAQELAENIAVRIDRIHATKDVIDKLEEDVIKILKSISIGGKPMA